MKTDILSSGGNYPGVNDSLRGVTNNYTIVIALFLIALLATSCGSRRQLPATGADSPAALSRRFGMRITTKDNLNLYTVALRWMGAPYRFGGNTRRGVDCSGFVAILYREVYRKPLAASSADMLKYNCRKVKRSGLREGDLVFFRTDRGRRKIPNHVGVYLKNGKFIHASSSRGVIVSSLSEPFYLRSWITGGRVK